MKKLSVCMVLLALFSAACSEKDVLSDSKAEGLLPDAPVILILESPESLQLKFQESSPIKAKVLYEADNIAVPDRPVKFSITRPNGGSSLSAFSATTGQDGRAQVVLTAGTERRSVQLVVSTLNEDGSEVKRIVNIAVVDKYESDLKVKPKYLDAVPLSNITVRLHNTVLDCAILDFSQLPRVIDLETIANVRSAAVFSGLEEGRKLTATITATGPTGEMVATGCKNDIVIPGRRQLTVEVDLNLLPLSVSGEYDFSTELHLHTAIPEPGDQIIGLISDFFESPTGALVDALVQGLTAAGVAGAGTGSTIDSILGAIPIDRVVDDIIATNSPEWLQETFRVGDDITDLLTDIQVGGDMTIGAVDAETGSFTGNWGWDSFLFRWRHKLECDPFNSCCGRTVYSGDELGFEPVASDFTGSVVRTPLTDDTSARRLTMDITVDRHDLSLKVGNLLLVIINKVILKSLTGQDSFSCALESIMGCEDTATAPYACGATTADCGCERFGSFIARSTNNAIQQQVGSELCRLALEQAEQQFEDRLNAIMFDGTELEMNGENNSEGFWTMEFTGKLEDKDMDMKTDELVGEATGQWTFGGAVRPEFESGVYALSQLTVCPNDAACAAHESCQPRKHFLDNCDVTFVCKGSVGDAPGADFCSRDNACQSGICMDSGRCLASCGTDDDCARSTVCSDEALVSGPDLQSLELNEDQVALQVRACVPVE